MTETERRRTYTETRVLIDSGKILATTFDDADLYFTGSQIELMRNLMQYANRPDSYVSDYGPGYYLIPDDTDWDAIQAIVADLEEVLMGNLNTLFGIHKAIAPQKIKIGSLPGTITLNIDACPSGEVWCITSITAFNATTAINHISLGAYVDGKTHGFGSLNSPAVAEEKLWNGALYLDEGDFVTCTFYGCASGDDVYLLAVGYSMVVP